MDPDGRGQDERGPDERGQDERGPDERGPDERGPDERGPDGRGMREMCAKYMTLENCRAVLRGFALGHGFLQAALESGDYLMHTQIPGIMAEKEEIEVESQRKLERVAWRINGVTIRKPTVNEEDGTSRLLMPHEARVRKLTYSATVEVSFTFTESRRNSASDAYRTIREVRHSCKPYCKIPVMVRSLCCNTLDSPESDRECPLDGGGYFIVNGTEKVIIMRNRMKSNVPYVRRMPPSHRFSHVCEIRSLPETKIRSTSTLLLYITAARRGAPPQVFVQMPFVSTRVQLSCMFRLLKVETKEEMLGYVAGAGPEDACLARLASYVLDDGTPGDTSYEATIQRIGKKGTKQPTAEGRSRRLQHTVANEFLPHMGLSSTPDILKRKAMFFGYAVRKLLMVFSGRLPLDDRDNRENMLVETPGALLAILFRQIHRNYIKTLLVAVRKTLETSKRVSPLALLNCKKITANIQYPLATGNWGTNKGGSTQTGVAQVLSRLTHAGTLSHLRRISSPVASEGKRAEPRRLDHSQYPIFCPAETPEGEQCGLMNNLALLAHVRVGHRSDSIRALILGDPNTTDLADCEDLRRGSKIFVNGTLMGVTRAPGGLLERLRERRQTGDIAHDTSLLLTPRDGEVRVTTGAGIPSRPVFILRELPRLPQALRDYAKFPNGLWKALLERGIVQYMDKDEEQMARVAPDARHMEDHPSADYTHVEIHPGIMLGLCANMIPFSQHNQSPRNMYSSSMMKQSMSQSVSNPDERVDAVSYSLVYGQQPLVQTATDQLLCSDALPSGQNPIVAVMTYTGYNCEDAIIVNKGSVERGLFRGEVFRTYRDEAMSHGANDGPHFEKVDPGAAQDVAGLRHGNYATLEDDGLPAVRSVIHPDDAVIGKVLQTASGQRRDLTTFSKTHEAAQVCKVQCMAGREGRTSVAVHTRSTRVPETGDKFASRHGQKGVCGILMPHEDMPFTVSSAPGGSIVPDFIVNPHGFPSRMTMAQQIEQLLGKTICAGSGELGDGSAFQSHFADPEAREDWIDLISDQLKEHGYQPHGKERMINGMTGALVEASVFIGPVFYQRLRHMAQDKTHARSTGPRALLTRQPTEGRAKDGGLRFGEMEQHNLVTYGASEVAKDRLFVQSDLFKVPVCDRCGLLAEHRKIRGATAQSNAFYCRNCRSGEHVLETHVPYAFKLLLQELYAMHIAARMEFT